jgi:hypothetical protein
MSDPGGWTTPDGWGPPSPAGPTPPAPPAGQSGAPQPPPPHGHSTYGYRPDVKPGVVPLRPLGLGELLDGSVGVLRRYPRPTLGLAAAVAVVATLANVLLLLTAFRPFVDLDSTTLDSGSTEALEEALGGAAVGGLLTGVLTLLSTAVLTGILTAVVGKAVLGQPLGLRGAWAQVRPLLLRLVGVAVLLALIAGGIVAVSMLIGILLIAAGGAALAIVGVPLILAGLAGAAYVYIRLSLAPCALVLEKVGATDSLRRSWLLVKGDWWRVFGITLLTIAVAMFVSLVIQVPFELLGYGSVSDLTGGGGDLLSTRTLIASSLGSIVAATLVDPFTAGVRALLYVDRRMRAEGLDVALTAAAANPQP